MHKPNRLTREQKYHYPCLGPDGGPSSAAAEAGLAGPPEGWSEGEPLPPFELLVRPYTFALAYNRMSEARGRSSPKLGKGLNALQRRPAGGRVAQTCGGGWTGGV